MPGLDKRSFSIASGCHRGREAVCGISCFCPWLMHRLIGVWAVRRESLTGCIVFSLPWPALHLLWSIIPHMFSTGLLSTPSEPQEFLRPTAPSMDSLYLVSGILPVSLAFLEQLCNPMWLSGPESGISFLRYLWDTKSRECVLLWGVVCVCTTVCMSLCVRERETETNTVKEALKLFSNSTVLC